MKPKQLHQEAMRYSFLAKEAFEKGDDLNAYDYYVKAANIENELAKFYLDKPELEPTRSTIIRSAAFLNLKAGAISEAQQLIFWGLLNIEDQKIREQLNEALEYSITLKNIDADGASHNIEYLRLLRQRSIHYTIETVLPKFGSAVTFEMISEFAENYLKSLKAYAVSVFKQLASTIKELSNDLDTASKQFEGLVNPLITSSAFGSFKFSIANDFLDRGGENREIVKLKSTILQQYHDKIFTNPLQDNDIRLIKEEFKEDEINQIFRPVAKIKSTDSPYKVAYYDKESLNKIYLTKIPIAQKRKLLPLKQVTEDDIGFLESSIIHARGSDGGKKSRSVILKERLKSYEFETKTNQIGFKDRAPLMLNEEIIINIVFNSDKGFTFTFDELMVEYTDTDYIRGLSNFYEQIYNRLISIVNASPSSGRSKEMKIVTRLINNHESLKK